MATIKVEVKTGKGGRAPLVVIDTKPVALDNNGKGSVTVTGSVGDQSNHIMSASYKGPVGATMGVTLTCGGTAVCEVKEMVIRAHQEPWGGTRKGFKL